MHISLVNYSKWRKSINKCPIKTGKKPVASKEPLQAPKPGIIWVKIWPKAHRNSAIWHWLYHHGRKGHLDL